MDHTQSDLDDDTLIYDSSPSRWELFHKMAVLQKRVNELEEELKQYKQVGYFGEK